jgi:uncharacterized protein (TIGR03067 family)
MLTRCELLAVAVALAFGAGVFAADPPPLQGVWRIDSADGADKQNAAHPQAGQDLVFVGGRLFIASNDPEFDGGAVAYRVRVRAGKTYAEIDLVQMEDRKEHKMSGVYAADGDKLRLSIPADRGGKVADFEKGDHRILVVAHRVKG